MTEEQELVQPRLKEFIADHKRRHKWKNRDFEKRGVSHTTIAAMLDPYRRVGEKSCQTISELFDLPIHTVLELAEILPEPDKGTVERRQLGHMYDLLTPDRQKALLDFALYLRTQDRQDRQKKKS